MSSMSRPPKETKKTQRIKKSMKIKKSTNANETPLSSDMTAKAEKTVSSFVDDLVDEVSPTSNTALQIHREFVTDTLLHQLQQKKNLKVEQAINESYRDATKQLRIAIVQVDTENANVTPIVDFLQRAKDHANEKLRICETIENELSANYRTTLNTLREKVTDLQPKSEAYHKEIEGIRNEEKIFDRNCALIGEKLDKLNINIDFAANKRDNICEQIMRMDKDIAGTLSMYQNCRQSNEKLNNEIYVVKSKLANAEEATTFCTKNASRWVSEKIAEVKKMKHEKEQLLKLKNEINASMENAKIENNNLFAKVNTLSEETAAKRTMLTRIRNANKNLLDETSSDVDCIPKSSALSADCKQLSDRIDTIQAELDKTRQFADDMTLYRTGIKKFRQKRDELKLRSRKLEVKIWKQEQKLEIMERCVRKPKSHRNVSVVNAKRQRVDNKDDVTNSRHIGSSSLDRR